jgi:chromosome segregation ATPase
MQNKTLSIITSIMISSITLFQGCSANNKADKMVVNPELSDLYNNESVGKRFQASESNSRSAVESAIELSQKYASLSADAASMSRQNQELSTRNKELEQQAATVEAKLQQAQKELKEANQMLVDMRVEINSWKSQVLGFREEMRSAETAQIEALMKILKALGAETTTTREKITASAASSTNAQ